jgi:peptide/nickel transport system permease protein
MRLMDAVLSFPPLVLALALGAVLGAGLTGVVIALGVVYTPTFARLMRGQVLSITAREYVDAARALGRRAGASPGITCCRTPPRPS